MNWLSCPDVQKTEHKRPVTKYIQLNTAGYTCFIQSDPAAVLLCTRFHVTALKVADQSMYLSESSDTQGDTMKQIFSLVLISGLFFAGNAFAGKKAIVTSKGAATHLTKMGKHSKKKYKRAKWHTVTSKINKACTPKVAYISVPEGRTATNFKLIKLRGGFHCSKGTKFKTRGFSITKGYKTKFKYSRNAKGKIHRPYGRLKNLKLGFGTYKIVVDGGKKAVVVLKYKM